MVKMNEWFTIRTLKSKGVGIKKIARQLGISRNTVRKYLRGDKPPQYIKILRVNDVLAPYADEIKVMIAKDFIGSRILEELRKEGYQGAQATFYRHLKEIKGSVLPSKVVERYETTPGEQGQYDWSEYTVLIDGVLTKVCISTTILGFSRLRHYYASFGNMDQGKIFEALEDSFRNFGGVPREILFDNPKAIVIRPRPDLIWNPKFLEFAGFYRFTPVACWPYRARTKGKVENPFDYLEEHFIKGREFRDNNDLITQLAEFESGVNNRVHGTTQEIPLVRFEQEKHLLMALPQGRFISMWEIFREVNWDCLISFDGSRYSVPWQYAGKSVWVRSVRGLELEIYAQNGALIARHDLASKKGTLNMKKEHYEGLRQRPPNTRAVVVKVFQEVFPDQTLFLEKLLAQYKFNAVDQLREILNLVRSYPKEEIRRAFAIALEYNTFSHNFVRGVLSQRAEFNLAEPPSGTIPAVPVVNISRDLNTYQALIERGE